MYFLAKKYHYKLKIEKQDLKAIVEQINIISKNMCYYEINISQNTVDTIIDVTGIKKGLNINYIDYLEHYINKLVGNDEADRILEFFDGDRLKNLYDNGVHADKL